jgi:hypothetical protein
MRLTHDVAIAMAKALLDVIAPALREEEQRDAFSEFYEICKAGIEAYEVQVCRMQKRLDPTRN